MQCLHPPTDDTWLRTKKSPQQRIFGCPTYAYVNDGKLELRQISTNPRFLRLIISKDVTFDKSAIVDWSKKSIGTDKDNSVVEQVEHEVEFCGFLLWARRLSLFNFERYCRCWFGI